MRPPLTFFARQRLQLQAAEKDDHLRDAAPELLEALTRLIIRCDDELADPEDVQDLQWAKSIARKARGES